MTFSSTVRHGNSTGSWNTIPTLRLGPLTRRPSSSTLPEDADRRPPRIRSSVVLPQPEGPTIVTNSPSATSSVTSASARIREPARVRYVFSRRDTAISGAVILGMVRRRNYVRKGPLYPRRHIDAMTPRCVESADPLSAKPLGPHREGARAAPGAEVAPQSRQGATGGVSPKSNPRAARPRRASGPSKTRSVTEYRLVAGPRADLDVAAAHQWYEN